MTFSPTRGTVGQKPSIRTSKSSNEPVPSLTFTIWRYPWLCRYAATRSAPLQPLGSNQRNEDRQGDAGERADRKPYRHEGAARLVKPIQHRRRENGSTHLVQNDHDHDALEEQGEKGGERGSHALLMIEEG
jgi:hypothetical protein